MAPSFQAVILFKIIRKRSAAQPFFGGQRLAAAGANPMVVHHEPPLEAPATPASDEPDL
jgi:hypothetical protein